MTGFLIPFFSKQATNETLSFVATICKARFDFIFYLNVLLFFSTGNITYRVEATAVNRADLLQRRGLYPPPPGVTNILGLEAAGTVADSGDGVDSALVGTRVMALLSGGGYANYAVVHAGHVLPVPRELSSQAGGRPLRG